MYFAGLQIPADPFAVGTERIVCGTLFLGAIASFNKLVAAFARAQATGGRLISLPNSWTGKLVTPTHALATFVPVGIYLLNVPLSGFQQPDWIKLYALPDFGLDGSTITLLRLFGCALSIASWLHAEHCVRMLGPSWHIIGVSAVLLILSGSFEDGASYLFLIKVREKPKIVNTGPYSIVRHPFYTCVPRN